MQNQVNDLRSAIELLKGIPGQYIETDVEVDPIDELSGVYRRIGSGGTVKRPTRLGPAMTFNAIKGHPGARVHIGLLASRKRVGYLLGCDPKRLGFLLNEAVDRPVAPVEVGADKALCQEVVYRAEDEGFDIRTILPAPTNTPDDAGPYLTLGMCYAHDPETGVHDVTIHRMCLEGPDELSIYMVPGARHIGHFYEVAEARGEALPISISIGVDPAIEVSTCFEPPTTPLGYDELSIAGALREQPVELARCLTIDELCIANAEYVIEGEILPRYAHRRGSRIGHRLRHARVPGLYRPRRAGDPRDQGEGRHDAQESHLPDLHRAERGAHLHDRHSHRGEHSVHGRARHARQAEERLLRKSWRRQVFWRCFNSASPSRQTKGASVRPRCWRSLRSASSSMCSS